MHSVAISNFADNDQNTARDPTLIMDILIGVSPDDNIVIRKEVPFIFKKASPQRISEMDFFIKCDNDQILDLNGYETSIELHHS